MKVDVLEMFPSEISAARGVIDELDADPLTCLPDGSLYIALLSASVTHILTSKYRSVPSRCPLSSLVVEWDRDRECCMNVSMKTIAGVFL
jgi:hypothetical protein